MKKIIASAVGLMLVGGVAATTASAVESQFGGYWRTRAFFQDNFSGTDNASFNTVDTRTRLYYTAKFSDDFKFVNKFEFNNNWGDGTGGDIGADGMGIFRIKNSYADFTLGKVNTKVGIQGATIARGFVFTDDFSGVVVTADLGMVKIPVLYGAVSTEDINGDSIVLSSNGGTSPSLGGGNGDIHLLSVMPSIKINDMVSVTPHATWLTITHQDTDIYWLGADIDLKFDPVKVGLTGIYNGGTIDRSVFNSTDDNDISAWLLAASADANLGMVGVHGQAFYGSGDDDADNDVDSFVTIGPAANYGSSYYWAEIMGAGTFDNAISSGSPGDKITNIWAINAGVNVKPMDKLTFNFDVWYAELAEDTNGPGLDEELGLELDAKLTYAIMDNLKADLIFAYLVAGDATGPEDVMEGGLQLSLSF